jgi:ABC-type transporter Mla MlaB component
MSDKATSTNDTATFVDPSMTMLRGEIDDDALAWLLAERERHLRILAGVPDAASVDLSLVKLPGAL